MNIQSALLSLAICTALTLSACSDDTAQPSGDSTNNVIPDMSSTPDQDSSSDMSAPDQDSSSDMSAADMSAADMSAADMSAADMSMIPDVAIDDFPTKLAQAYCERAILCCTREEIEEYFGGEACVPSFVTSLRGILPTSEEVRAGTVRYDAALAKSLIETVSGSMCEQRPFISPFFGLIAAGQACAADYECATPAGKRSACLQDAEDITRPKTCFVTKGRGEACQLFSECDAGLNCKDNVCEVFGTRPGGAPCDSDFDCETRLCGREVPGTCNAKLALEERCSGDYQCQSGFCDESSGFAGFCVATPPAPTPNKISCTGEL